MHVHHAAQKDVAVPMARYYQLELRQVRQIHHGTSPSGQCRLMLVHHPPAYQHRPVGAYQPSSQHRARMVCSLAAFHRQAGGRVSLRMAVHQALLHQML